MTISVLCYMLVIIQHNLFPIVFSPSFWQTLTNALCKELSEKDLKLQCEVLGLSSSSSNSSLLDSWSVSYASQHKKMLEEKSFDAVIVTVSCWNIDAVQAAGTSVIMMHDCFYCS